MSSRVIVAGVIGGIVLYAWGFVAHILLPLGQVGFRALPDEARTIADIEKRIPEPGLYLYPWMDTSEDRSKEEQAEQMEELQEKYRQKPRGIITVRSPPGSPMSPRQLIVQFLSDIAAVVLAVFLLVSVGGLKASFLSKFLFFALLGPLAVVVISVPNWNWYGFPADFTLARFIDHLLGWSAVGIVLVPILRKPRTDAA